MTDSSMRDDALDDKPDWERTDPVLLTIEQIQILLSPWLGARRVIDAQLLAGGLINRNFRVRLDAAPDVCVLRLYDRDPSACLKEAAILERVGQDIPGPTVLYTGEKGEDHPPFLVLSYVEGIALFALRKSGDVAGLAEACFDAGRVLARLGAFQFAREGFLSGELDVDRPFVDASHVTFVDRVMASPTFQRRIPADVRSRLIQFIETMEQRVSELRAAPTLVHGDYNSANVVVARGANGWRVSAVLDWEFAVAASPYCDVGNFLRYHRSERPRYEPDFSRGLREGGMDLPADWLTIARLMDLPACCELLTCDDIPGVVVREVRDLILATIDGRPA